MKDKILQKCCENRDIVFLYLNDNDMGLQVIGYVDRYQEEVLLMDRLTEYGEYDGYMLLHTSDIQRVQIGGKNGERMKKLCRYHPKNHNKILCRKEFLVFDFLESAKEEKLVVGLEIDGEEIIGLVEQYNEDDVKVIILDELDGSEQGIAVIEIDSVSMYFMDTKKMQDIKLLYLQRKEKVSIDAE